MRIEKYIPVRETEKCAQRIPRKIHQTFKTDDLPLKMYRAVRSWIDKNPAYEYFFYDDNDILEYIEAQDFSFASLCVDKKDILRAFGSLYCGAAKADMFRYIIIYFEGGCYFDIDTVCKDPLDSWIRPSDDVVSGIGGRADLHQWGLIYNRHHPFMKRAIELCTLHIIQKRFVGKKQNLDGLLGPALLDYAAKDVLGVPQSFTFSPGLLRISDLRITILDGDYFNNHVVFKYDGYIDDLRSVNVTYWMHSPIFVNKK